MWRSRAIYKEMEDYDLSAPSCFRPKDSGGVLHGVVMRK